MKVCLLTIRCRVVWYTVMMGGPTDLYMGGPVYSVDEYLRYAWFQSSKYHATYHNQNEANFGRQALAISAKIS